MDEDPLSYEKWVEEALRDVIKRALELTAAEGLPGDHHFFITFLTDREDVDIPDHLRAGHPDEMTIVMQHQFQNLSVTDDGFSVTLSFSGRPCHLSIPFSAIIAFADPAINFVLQLKMTHETHDASGLDDEDARATTDRTEPALAAVESEQDQPGHCDAEGNDDENQPGPEDDEDKMGEVITLDAFRKK